MSKAEEVPVESEQEFDRLVDGGAFNPTEARIRLGLGVATTEVEVEIDNPEGVVGTSSQREFRKPTSARGKMFADIGRAASEHKSSPYGHRED